MLRRGGSAALAFLLVGAGVHMVQTVGLALATDLVPEKDQPKAVGLMYVMLLLGMVVSALVFGWLLEDYTPGRLIQVIQGAAVTTVALNLIALWKQEARDRTRAMAPPPREDFVAAWRGFVVLPGAKQLLAVIALGTAGFGMADVLLEPYGGQVVGLSVAQTTRLTAIMAAGSLVGFGLASRVLGNGAEPLSVAFRGALAGIPGFVIVMVSAALPMPGMLQVATLVLGFGAGMFAHGTLTATMRSAPPERVGLALGAWGAVQATAAGLAIAIGGLVRDVIAVQGGAAADAYLPVFAAEIVLLMLAAVFVAPLVRYRTGEQTYKV